MYNYVIFHKGCNDGFTSFIILNNTKKIDNDAIIYPDVPSTNIVPQNIDNKNVIIMDVAYKYDILKSIVNRANSVTFIDHHISIHDDTMKIKNEITDDKVKIIYDENESGASLTWKYFNKDKKLPLFVQYIKDNDIGAWKLKNTLYFMAYLDVKFNMSLNKENIDHWNTLYNKDNMHKIIKKGKTYYEYIDHLAYTQSKRYSLELFPSVKLYSEYPEYFNKPGEYTVAVYCGNGCPSVSLLGVKMSKTIKCDFVIFWTLHLDRKEYVLSFRSDGTDVSKIAKIFNGGGHKQAAAGSFSITKYNITDLFFNNSLPRNR